MSQRSITGWMSICLMSALAGLAGCPASECYSDLDCAAEAYCGDENTCVARPADTNPAADAGPETTDAGNSDS